MKVSGPSVVESEYISKSNVASPLESITNSPAPKLSRFTKSSNTIPEPLIVNGNIVDSATCVVCSVRITVEPSSAESKFDDSE